MKKKLFLLMTIACISFAFIGCGRSNDSDQTATEQPTDNATDDNNGVTDGAEATDDAGTADGAGATDDARATDDATATDNGVERAIDDIGNDVDDALNGR